LRRPTTSLDATAWWNDQHGQEVNNMSLKDRLNRLCQTNTQIKLLFRVARRLAGAIPCKAQLAEPSHRYQVNNRSPFRIRCCCPGCNNKLQRAAVIQRIIQVVENGILESDALMKEIEDEMEEQEAELGIERERPEVASKDDMVMTWNDRTHSLRMGLAVGKGASTSDLLLCLGVTA
jgi:hypothetical protein